ncbi:YrrC family ATP-dependent DNA helicase [Candidatus Paracaedibacter symbiosus]|uniref:YrrC family ATP-dependent DNA helicase n=1 Tax=Candidatus Paracaedibacter symbiosus TaxID=244582 RepID=UPI000509F036|nr:hypothetical protein [Candidatus Paracaedibacter symbiosus]
MVKGALSTSQAEDLQEIIERVTYHNPDNGFCVLPVKVNGQRDLVTVVGSSRHRQGATYPKVSSLVF